MTAKRATKSVKLLMDRAIEGLLPAQRAELSLLLERFPELDDDSLELAAAAVDLAHTVVDQPMPSALRERVAARAADFFGTPRPNADRPRETEH